MSSSAMEDLGKDSKAAGAASSAAVKQPRGGNIHEVAAALSDRFVILKSVGASENVEVYLAQDRNVQREAAVESGNVVVLKVLSSSAAGDPMQLELFYFESHAAAKLSHMNVIKAGEARNIGGIHFCVLEHNPGQETLRGLLDRKAWLDINLTIGIIHKIAGGLDHSHRNGVLHLKLQPESILLKADGAVLITGFGLDGKEELASMHQQRSSSLPSQYLSPEQALGEHVDHRSDLYSLGVLLFEMLTDRLPLDSGDPEEIKRKHIAQAPKPPHAFRPDVPELLSAITMKLLEKSLHKRFQSAESIQTLLNRSFGLHPGDDAAIVEAAAPSVDGHREGEGSPPRTAPRLSDETPIVPAAQTTQPAFEKPLLQPETFHGEERISVGGRAYQAQSMRHWTSKLGLWQYALLTVAAIAPAVCLMAFIRPGYVSNILARPGPDDPATNINDKPGMPPAPGPAAVGNDSGTGSDQSALPKQRSNVSQPSRSAQTAVLARRSRAKRSVRRPHTRARKAAARSLRRSRR